ncbi:MAG: L,D-transpeptidase, partial [Pseudomonadota bacterium]
GQNAPLGAVFHGRRATGEIWTPQLHAAHPERDWILTRILWLRGLEFGRNRGGPVDSFARYIYIHGTPDSEPVGRPGSHGCIRMRNEDIVRLFARVGVGTPVDIVSDAGDAD